MTDKIRKRLRPVSVVATIAVLGLLAAFIALAALPDSASAQGPPPPPPPPVVMARRRRRRLRWPNQLPTGNAAGVMEPIVRRDPVDKHGAMVSAAFDISWTLTGDRYLTFAVGSSKPRGHGELVDGDLESCPACQVEATSR